MSKRNKRVESVSEFLARGGKITVLPYKKPETTRETIRNAVNTGISTVLTFEEAELFYGEAKSVPAPKAPSKQPKIDLSVLPAALRERLLSKLQDEVDDE